MAHLAERLSTAFVACAKTCSRNRISCSFMLTFELVDLYPRYARERGNVTCCKLP